MLKHKAEYEPARSSDKWLFQDSNFWKWFAATSALASVPAIAVLLFKVMSALK